MRRDREVTITAEGRDKGKRFYIVEMPADQGERWAMRAVLALMRSGIQVPDNLATGGLAVIATIGLQAFVGLSWGEAEPLLAEMWDCVSIVEDKAEGARRKPTPDDIEEVATRVRLRSEVIDLHLGFSLSAKVSELTKALREVMDEPAPSLKSPTSRARSQRSSRRA